MISVMEREMILWSCNLEKEMSVSRANLRKIQLRILPKDPLVIKSKDQGWIRELPSKPRNGRSKDD